MKSIAHAAPAAVDIHATPKARSRNLALDRARTFLTLVVLAHHAVIPYTYFGHTDPTSWIGFDCVVLATDSFFMAMFFLLSGLFVWPGLGHKPLPTFLELLGPREHIARWETNRYGVNHEAVKDRRRWNGWSGAPPLTFLAPYLSKWQPIDCAGCQEGKETALGVACRLPRRAVAGSGSTSHSISRGGQKPC